MIAFGMVMRCEFRKGFTQELFTEEDHPVVE